jgi:hypothetical protein
VRRLVLIDAPVPGVGPWEEMLKNPLLWHFRFGGPDMERLVAAASGSISTGSGTSSRPRRRASARRPACTTPRSMRAGCDASGFAQFAAFDQDAIDNRAFLAGRPAADAGAGCRRREIVRPMMAP